MENYYKYQNLYLSAQDYIISRKM